MTASYRHLAREALTRAQSHLQSAEPHRIRYAALELRMCIEALTYDRAQAYAREIPPSEVDKWQPKKLMEVLLEIEPHADQSGTISFARESSLGAAAEPTHLLGHERVFGMDAIRKHYDALGSFVHLPTMRNAHVPPEFDKMRTRCNEVATKVAEALSSTIHNFTLGSFSQLDCQECGKPIRKRISTGQISVVAKCFHCPASYLLTPLEGNKVDWKPQQQSVACATEGCGHVTHIWESEIRLGSHWTCPSCGAKDQIQPAVGRVAPATRSPTETPPVPIASKALHP
jgi:hypothetical protein